MNRNVPCVTCKHNLLDTGKTSPDPHFVYCTNCLAYYVVIPVIDENGRPRFDPATGDMQYYLDPVRPGNPAMDKESKFQQPEVDPCAKPDFSKLLKKIYNADSPKKLLDSIDNDK